MNSPADPFAEIERGTEEILPRDEFRARLATAEQAGKRLVVKAGFDPTASMAEPEPAPPPPSRTAKKQAAKAHAKQYRKARRGERRSRGAKR